MIEINRTPSTRDLTAFGLMLVGFVVLLGFVAVYWWKTPVNVAKWIWIVGGVLSLVYWVARPLRRVIFVGWMIAAFPIGWTVSHALLGFIYYAVVTPIGLAVRAFGSDPMSRTLDRSGPTYWTKRERVSDTARYFKQF